MNNFQAFVEAIKKIDELRSDNNQKIANLASKYHTYLNMNSQSVSDAIETLNGNESNDLKLAAIDTLFQFIVISGFFRMKEDRSQEFHGS